MTNFEDHIQKAAEGYSLSSDEKARMERVITQYMRFKPIRSHTTTTVTTWTFISYLHRPIAAALILVLASSSTVAYAAESALPGDALYGIKTVINEPVRVALAQNAEAKAEVQMEIAERRIEEATVLSAEGRLDDSTQESLAASFKSYAAAVSESIEEAAAEDTSASLELAARFETRLIAHESVLAEVEMEMDTEAGSDHSTRLSDAIRATSDVLAGARFERDENVVVEVATDGAATAITATSVADAGLPLDTTATMSMSLTPEPPAGEANMEGAKLQVAIEAPLPEKPAPSERALFRMKSAAEKSFRNAERALQKSRSLSADAKARAEADLALASDSLENGEDYLDEDAQRDAYSAFEESLRVSEQAFVYIKAAPSLEKARARNASRRAGNTSNTEAQKGIDASIEVTLPGATVTTTVTTPTSSSTTNGTSTEDEPAHDEDEEHDEEEENEDRGTQEGTETPGLRFWQRLNISL